MSALPTIGLRPATADDLAAIVRLEHRPEHQGAVGQWPAERHRSLQEQPGCEELVVLCDGAFGGYVVLRDEPPATCWIDRIVVDRPGEGIGRRALAAVLARLAARDDIVECRLDVVDDNLRAQRAYAAAGFALVGEVRGQTLNGREVDLLVMACPVTGS